MSSSEAPKEAKPSSCDNSAKLGFDNKGTWPNNSCTQSLE